MIELPTLAGIPSNVQWSPGYDDDGFDRPTMYRERIGRRRRNADLPINPHLTIPDSDIIAALDLEQLISKTKEEEALRILIANLMRPEVLRDHCWIFYSRDANHYSQRFVRFYCPDCYTRTFILRLNDALKRIGLIENDVVSPSSQAWFRSRMRPTPEFADRLRRHRRRPRRQRTQLIVLKSDDKKLVTFDETAETAARRQDVAQQNEALRQYEITLPTAALSTAHLWSYGLDYPVHRFEDETYYRVFNQDWQHGGRFYGPLWQRLPKRWRAHIQIDGQATAEPDLLTCHPRLLCAVAGCDLPFEDAGFDFYELIGRNVPCGIHRPHVKTAFGTMICAGTELMAIRAMANELQMMHMPNAFQRAQKTLSAMADELPQLRPYFFTGIGLRLQNIDAAICANVQQYCRRHGISCLSIHDGFCVPAAHQSLIVEVMNDEMRNACGTISED